jgi:CubicO group peptidase (beta-lactamase class C family)
MTHIVFGRVAVMVALLVQTTSLHAQRQTAYPHAAEPIGTVRQVYDGTLPFDLAVNTYRNIDRLFPSRIIAHTARRPLPLPRAIAPLGALSFTDSGRTYTLEQYLDTNRVTGLLVLHRGRIALELYRHGNSPRTRWMSMSVAKSITSTLTGAAIQQGKLRLTDSVTTSLPALRGSAYDGVSVRDVLMMTSGVLWNETYTDPRSDRRRLLEAQIAQRPGSALEVMRTLSRAAPPGTRHRYSTGETQIAGEVLRSAVGTSLSAYLADRIWQRVGMEADATWWLDSPNGHEIGGSGFSATLRDYGRFGLFLLNNGVVGRDTVLPPTWLADATSPKVLRGDTPLDYGYLWWTPETVASTRDHAYAAEGIFGQWLYVNPVQQVVIVVWSAQAKPTGSSVVNDWSFFDAVVSALSRTRRSRSSR